MAETVAVRPQPLIAVRDVMASTRWYSTLLGLRALGETEEDTHGNVYNRLLSGQELVLQLHSWDDEQHPNLVGEHAAKHGHGVLLWFEVADFDAAVKRAAGLAAEVVAEPHVNPGPRHREIWIRDLDGYVVVIASPDGEAVR
jgi:catechol 2,3-dioxygenase-like lactoylglutathione lyase family enzyme